MTQQFVTVPNLYVVACDGVKYAYRKLEKPGSTPLVFLQHFTGTMDAWDPSVVDALAKNRTVIVFDNAGVGASGGSTPDTVEQMTVDAENFIQALGLGEVDLMGFSLGGFIAQLMATRDKVPVRKVVSAGSAPQGGEEHLMKVVADAFSKNAPDVRLPLFFTPTAKSQAAGQAFITRAAFRKEERDPESGEEISNAQAKAIIGWCANKAEGNAMLKQIRQPTLIVHGSDDTMFPGINAYEMFKNMTDATLIMYPDSGHGALFQYSSAFSSHVDLFLAA
ncbi:alpha/beta hydrolase [Tardiphaga sp. P9-11]|uniref:alpha/beta fold hydrolase n=1 Tax=Tardiphaga sp. P9-11 TaxID=2024614 RepID=UPI0011F2E2BC|nr:alpha/beta hydrolase [Tardiphaga sp. P9-11]KAA0073969.1 alpha/beta hydrolase [Tardiphaga sp. P9-11]